MSDIQQAAERVRIARTMAATRRDDASNRELEDALREFNELNTSTRDVSTHPRPLSTIAQEIRHDWKGMYFGAVPYVDAMLSLDDINDMYGHDSAKGIVLYFLSNARAWRGPVAKRIKLELNQLVKSAKR